MPPESDSKYITRGINVDLIYKPFEEHRELRFTEDEETLEDNFPDSVVCRMYEHKEAPGEIDVLVNIKEGHVRGNLYINRVVERLASRRGDRKFGYEWEDQRHGKGYWEFLSEDIRFETEVGELEEEKLEETAQSAVNILERVYVRALGFVRSGYEEDLRQILEDA
ncbi:MAG: hypothetical protein SVV03_03670 [Candidatus Nanohaloarchaea archaeon]|nr:hypothetical protein [Candidatus Nanohaloarchaea archaeon]